jgi:hypothetical protein
MVRRMTAIREPMDILIWSDGYWCFRSDYPKQARQDYAYHLISLNTREWLYISATPSQTPGSEQAAQFIHAFKDDSKPRPL